jgi:hypothetical protein
MAEAGDNPKQEVFAFQAEINQVMQHLLRRPVLFWAPAPAISRPTCFPQAVCIRLVYVSHWHLLRTIITCIRWHQCCSVLVLVNADWSTALACAWLFPDTLSSDCCA